MTFIKEKLIRLLRRCNGLFPESTYLKLMFRLKMGYKLDLKNPRTFSEKLQWLKLYNRRPEYTMMVDKYAVKEYVSGIIGQEHVIPTLGVWSSPDEIEWDKLPEQFVLKVTHSGGSNGVVICEDKNTFDRNSAKQRLSLAMGQNLYKYNKEWPYKNVPKRIIAEQYINPAPDVSSLPDFKWYCFDGEPKFCQVIQNRDTIETIDFFDTNWNHQEFVGLTPGAKNAEMGAVKPNNIETHLKIARELSKGLPFSRIDLYETGMQTFFGEITFYPASGFGGFRPDQYNEILGMILKLPGVKLGGGDYQAVTR